jgi:hypothetical protein
MKTMALRLVFAAVGLAQTNSKAGGHWEGNIQMPKRELGIAVDLAKNAKGAWIGSMSMVGSSAIDVPLDSVAVEDMAVRFTASLPEQTSFDGHLSADASSLSGTVSNAVGGVPFQLARTGEADVKVPRPSSALSKEFEGAWEGTHEDNGTVRPVGLKMWPAGDGTAAAKLIVVDKGNLEIPVTTVTIKGMELQLEARAVSGTYRGTLGAGGEIAGEWSEGPVHFPLTFKRVSSETKKP